MIVGPTQRYGEASEASIPFVRGKSSRGCGARGLPVKRLYPHVPEVALAVVGCP